jgi:hypothetical protein
MQCRGGIIVCLREENKTTKGMLTDVTDGLTIVKRVRRHVGIRLTERDAVQCVGDVKSMRLRGHKLVDMPSIPHNAFAVCNVKVSSYFVDAHVAVDSTSLSLDGIDKRVHIVTYALLRVTQDVGMTPTLRIVRVLQLIAGIAAPERHMCRRDTISNRYNASNVRDKSLNQYKSSNVEPPGFCLCAVTRSAIVRWKNDCREIFLN